MIGDLYFCEVWSKQPLCKLHCVDQEQFQFGIWTKFSDRQKRESRSVRKCHPNIPEPETRKISAQLALQNFSGEKERRQELHQKVVVVRKLVLVRVGVEVLLFSDQIFAPVFEKNVHSRIDNNYSKHYNQTWSNFQSKCF